MDERCGNCLYNRYAGEFTCSNECSDNYDLPTGYNDSCEDWEEK